MKTLVLFGSNGFVGKNLKDFLISKKHLHILFPNQSECDLLKSRKVKSYLDIVNPDYIINAAYIEVNSNVKPTKKYLDSNLKISNNILKACKDKKNLQKIIFFGSGLEYGDSDTPIDETHPLNPKNYYAKTKAIQSQTSLNLANEFNLPLVLIKPFNLYGPHDNKSVFFYVISSILQKKAFSITKGEQIRDILYIEDLCVLVEKALFDNTISSGEVINAGFGKGILLRDIIDSIFKITKYEGEITFRNYRDNEYFSQVADIQKAKKLVGWEPITPIELGLQKTIAWVTAILH